MRFFQHLSGARFVSTILSVQVLANLAAAANTCSNDEPPQPIGIDFAQDVMHVYSSSPRNQLIA